MPPCTRPHTAPAHLAAGTGALLLAAMATAAPSTGCEPPSSRAPVPASSTSAATGAASGPTAAAVAAPQVNAGASAITVTSPVPSQVATWKCTGTPCPWGNVVSNHAVPWPAAAGALSARLGYTVSAPVYLPADRANGADIAIDTGAATIHAGAPANPTHRLLATLTAGQVFHVADLVAGDVVSVQGDAPFSYHFALPPPGSVPTAPAPATPTPAPAEGGAASPPSTAPSPPHPAPPPPSGPRGPTIRATVARWRCHKTPGCFSDPWTGAVIPWPEGSAYQSNGRTGNVLRFVHTTGGDPLYPYMGAWAEGCEVTAVDGIAKVIEWRRGAEEWRENLLQPGQSHVIHLVPPENGALIESADDKSTFSVSLRNCHPQRIPPEPSQP